VHDIGAAEGKARLQCWREALFQLKYVAWLMLALRQISATGMPSSLSAPSSQGIMSSCFRLLSTLISAATDILTELCGLNAEEMDQINGPNAPLG
jgi:hypothetical protein